MNFIVPVLKKLTSKGDKIKIFRAHKLYPHVSNTRGDIIIG